MQLKITHNWEQHWNPKAYLAQYYQTVNIAEDEKAVCRFIRSQLDRRGELFERALDIGVGPTLHHEIALAPYVSWLDVADFLPQNLVEIEKWLAGDASAYDWDIYLRGILAMERSATPNAATIEARKRLVRQRINRLLRCNIKNKIPLESGEQYPLVTAFYVADSVASVNADWFAYMSNIANLVEPGGLLMISALRNALYYRVGEALFPSAMVNEGDVERLYRSLNFVPRSIQVRVEQVPTLRPDGFESIITAVGTKRV
jgi:hypothetical protein